MFQIYRSLFNPATQQLDLLRRQLLAKILGWHPLVFVLGRQTLVESVLSSGLPGTMA